MRLVDRPAFRPNHCAVIPGKREDPVGFIDCGHHVKGFDPHLYVSSDGVRMFLKTLGWPAPEDFTEKDDLVQDLQRTVTDLEAQLREADRELDAVEVLKRAPKWSEAKRAGRPPKKATADV